jgi:predicted enzyme related to lactoylglutathione lyase
MVTAATAPESAGLNSNAVIRLEHVGIHVARAVFAETLKFYEEQFGWRRVREIVRPERSVIFLSDGSAMIEFVEGDGMQVTDPNHTAFCVGASEFDATLARLTAAGVLFDEAKSSGDGSMYAFFSDPAGNRCQLVGRVRAFSGGEAD